MACSKGEEGQVEVKKLNRKTVSRLFLIWISPVTAAIMTILYILNMVGVLPPLPNRPPEIQDGIRLSRPVVSVGEIVPVRVIVKDPDAGDETHYFWAAYSGKIGEQLDRFQGPEVIYVAPDLPGIDIITVMVYDREGETDKDCCIVTIREVERLRSPP